MRRSWTTAWHRMFTLGILVKGLDGLLELAGGGALLLSTRPTILYAVTVLTRGELIEDPGDFIANHLVRMARDLSLGAREFAGIYLFAHGVVKIAMVAGLLREKRWAYPFAVVVMLAFIGYQGYRLWQSPGWGFTALTLLDVIITGLIVHEWRQRRRRVRQPKMGAEFH